MSDTQQNDLQQGSINDSSPGIPISSQGTDWARVSISISTSHSSNLGRGLVRSFVALQVCMYVCMYHAVPEYGVAEVLTQLGFYTGIYLVYLVTYMLREFFN